ncbi:hypothetical protein BJY01DRAFT_167119 [Aspergillus pseudoustus]|uniref:Zn(2)-C6 fungal-type domain-containing protein n=1 Tax=Aspergillus pseudoustus TaxID=1810923 RepID=A0ABR4IB75_9EURO
MPPGAQEYTAESCLACKTKKRKCDKQLPACSRCMKGGQQCLYGNNAGGVYGELVPLTDNKPSNLRSNSPLSEFRPDAQPPPTAARGSCRRCGKLKKRCDKAYPSCSRCKRLDSPCVYERLQRLRMFSFEHLLYLDLIPLKVSYPVEAKPHIPALVKSFQERMGLAELAVEVDSLAYHLRSSWIRHALTDPGLFHATVYTASAQLDTLRETTEPPGLMNPVTLYHQTKAIAAVNSQIASGGTDMVGDATIAAVLLLVITGSLQKDTTATEVHRLGLLRMVAMRGGLEKLGFEGFLARMIEMNMVLPAVVFDQLDTFVLNSIDYSLPAAGNLPALSLERLAQGTSGSLSVRTHMTAIFAHIWELLLAVDCAREDTSNREDRFDFATARFILDEHQEPTPAGDSSLLEISNSENAMVWACEVSLRILRYLLDTRLPPPQQQPTDTTLITMVEELKSHMAASDPEPWLKYAPHANLWVTTLGMAVSEEVQGRLWFLMHERCVVMSMKTTQPAAHEMVWECYRWIRELILARQCAE